jgi:hypothetical protein
MTIISAFARPFVDPWYPQEQRHLDFLLLACGSATALILIPSLQHRSSFSTQSNLYFHVLILADFPFLLHFAPGRWSRQMNLHMKNLHTIPQDHLYPNQIVELGRAFVLGCLSRIFNPPNSEKRGSIHITTPADPGPIRLDVVKMHDS